MCGICMPLTLGARGHKYFDYFEIVCFSFYNAIKRYKHVNLFCEREPTKMPEKKNRNNKMHWWSHRQQQLLNRRRRKKIIIVFAGFVGTCALLVLISMCESDWQNIRGKWKENGLKTTRLFSFYFLILSLLFILSFSCSSSSFWLLYFERIAFYCTK